MSCLQKIITLKQRLVDQGGVSFLLLRVALDNARSAPPLFLVRNPGVFQDAFMAARIIQRKLLAVGDSSVGTTCLLFTYMKEFPSTYAPVWNSNNCVDIEVDDACVELSLFVRRASLCQEVDLAVFYNDANVVLMCFSVDNRNSLDSISSRWVPEVKKHSLNIPYLVVATKTDLRNNPTSIQQLKDSEITFVSSEEGRDVAEMVGACGYCECSALEGVGMSEVFEAATREALKYEANKTKTGKLKTALGQLKSAFHVKKKADKHTNVC